MKEDSCSHTNQLDVVVFPIPHAFPHPAHRGIHIGMGAGNGDGRVDVQESISPKHRKHTTFRIVETLQTTHFE